MNSDRSGECLFCKLLAERDDEKNWILHRGDHCFVIINTYPYSNGHVMVVCNRHVDRFAELSPQESVELMEMVSLCEKAVFDSYKPGGINMGANLGRSAGAGILGHLHVHLVPRWQGDTNFMTAVGETRVVSEDLAETCKRLKPYFKS
ncbi:MAG: HIT domain-containing protein [Candidatus Krumholzibacteriia bacterium]